MKCVIMHDMDTFNFPWEAKLLDAMREERSCWISHRNLAKALNNQGVGVKVQELLNITQAKVLGFQVSTYVEDQKWAAFKKEEEAA